MHLFKKLLISAALVLLPSASFANLDGLKINFVAAFVENDEECAAEGEITSDQGGLINGTERIAVNGITWGDFSSLPLSGYEIGDKISFGTDALALRLGVSFDVKLDGDLCKGLRIADAVEFFGSEGTSLSRVEIGQPAVNRAWALSDDGAYDEVDLAQNSLMGSNLAGASWTLGNGPLFGVLFVDPQTGGGCNLGLSPANGALASWWMIAPLLGLAPLRFLRRNARKLGS